MSRLLYSIDPGTLQSALVVVRRGGPYGIEVLSSRLLLNAVALAELSRVDTENAPCAPATLVIEQMQAMGMTFGCEVRDTLVWSGRFYEAWLGHSTRHWLLRGAVKMHLCGSMRAKDANIRQVLMDRFGGSSAKGTKAKPGPLHGVSGHCFAALAVAVTWLDQHPRVEPGAAGRAGEASCDARVSLLTCERGR